MTVLELLRVLARIGAGLKPIADGGLRWTAKAVEKTAELRAAVVEHKAVLQRAVDSTVLRLWFRIPFESGAIDGTLAVVLAWLDAERATFTEPERVAWAAAVSALLVQRQPRWFAEVLAVEDVIRARGVSLVLAIERSAAA